MTPVQRPQTSSETLRSNFYANVQGGQPPIMSYPNQHGYGPPAFSPTHCSGAQVSPIQPGLQALDSTQMQTPPPTRDTSAKKPQQTEIAFGTPSTIASRRFMTPQQPPPPPPQQHQISFPAPQQTPSQFPQLQFSPDVHQFANFGPASAPVMPQTQFLWDGMGSVGPLPPPVPLEDPFAPQPPTGPWSSASPQPPLSQPAAFQTPGMNNFQIQDSQLRPSTAAPLTGHMPVQHAQLATSASLDPSLIYSSPARPIVRSSSRRNIGRPDTTLSVEKRKDSAVPLQAPQISDTIDGEPAFAGPGLRRSNTVGTARPKSSNSSGSASETTSRSNSFAQPPRTISPLKRVGRTPLGSISEHKPKQRPSVVLTVDENGNARTETRRVEDSSPTKSIRDRYPGLFDSDSSDDESDTSEQPPSRNASFKFAQGEERKMKAARLDPPVENLEGIDLARSSSRASNKGVTPSRAAIAAAATLRRQGSLRRSSRTTPAKRLPATRSTSSLLDTCPMDVSGEQFPALGGAESEFALDTYNRQWSSMSFDQQPRPAPTEYRRPPPSFHPVPVLRNGPLIRCVCGVPHDRGQLMVQCSSCTQFLHMPCVGLDGNRLPTGYVCFVCEKPGGR